MSDSEADEVDGGDVDVEIQKDEHLWRCCFQTLPSKEIVYFTQIGLVYIVVITSIINLSLNIEPSDLWITLLSSCLGYVLPSPNIQNSGNLNQ